LNSGLAYVNKYEGRVPYNLPFKNASAFYANTDNKINTSDYQQGGTPFYFEIQYIPKSFSTTQGLFNTAYSSTQKGFIISQKNISGSLSIGIFNITSVLYSTVNTVILNNVNTVTVSWNGLIGGVVTITINGVVETFIATISWTGNASLSIGLLHYLTNYLNGVVLYVKYNINNLPQKYIPFVQKLGVAMPTVYDVNSDTAYTIAGTVTSAKTVAQDSYFYAQTQGYTDDGTNYVPASKLNSGYDVLGVVLTNPSSDKGIDKNTYVQQFLAPALIYASACSTFFDKPTLSAVTAKLIQGSSIPTNCDNQEFSNQRTTDVTDILIYDVEKTVDEVNKILICNARTNTEIVFLIDENGNYLVDEYGYLKIE